MFDTTSSLAEVIVFRLEAGDFRQTNGLAIAYSAPKASNKLISFSIYGISHVEGLTLYCGSPVSVLKTGDSLRASKSAFSSMIASPEIAYAESSPPMCRMAVSKNGALRDYRHVKARKLVYGEWRVPGEARSLLARLVRMHARICRFDS